MGNIRVYKAVIYNASFLSYLSFSDTPLLNSLPHRFIPLRQISLIERVNLARLRNFNVRVSEDELSDGLVEGETVDAAADGHYEETGGGVQAVAGGD